MTVRNLYRNRADYDPAVYLSHLDAQEFKKLNSLCIIGDVLVIFKIILDVRQVSKMLMKYDFS
jgi:hypothetical protein